MSLSKSLGGLIETLIKARDEALLMESELRAEKEDADSARDDLSEAEAMREQAEARLARIEAERETGLGVSMIRAWTFVMRSDREKLYKHMASEPGADEAIAVLKAAAGDV